MTAKEIQARCRSLADPAHAAGAARFFKTGPGQYGEKQVFLGLRAATLRQLARAYRQLQLDEVEKLLRSPIHDERAVALLILVDKVHKAPDAVRKQVFDTYRTHTPHVNSWALVDVSAPPIAGGYLHDKSRQPLFKWAKSKCLWERRIAIVATQYFIRLNDFDDTLKIAKVLLGDQEDLIHKAAGWMLREVGQRDQPTLEAFLKDHYSGMPRTMLRYAIERFEEKKRRAYLEGKIS
jgi:3-methyladenine DNA glycosylase AlkD